MGPARPVTPDLVLTDRSDAVLRDPSRLFGLALALLLVVVPAGLLALRSRGVSLAMVLVGFGGLVLAIVAIGYPLQRHYLDDRYLNDGPEEDRIPQMHLDSAYRWARGISDARIGLAGTTAGFLQYGFYGTDLSNHVIYLGETGPDGAFNAIPGCAAFRSAVNAAQLDYLVTSPFLNFIQTGRPISSPEARWLRGDRAMHPIQRSGPVTVWRVDGPPEPAQLQGTSQRPPAGCAPAARERDLGSPRELDGLNYSSLSGSALSAALEGRRITI